MEQVIIRKKDLPTIEWGGGRTTELFIFPKGTSYKERNFDIRISTATVEESPSQFTALPNYKRVLMPLDFKVNLTTNGKDFSIRPFNVIEFDGGSNTVSSGTCSDIGIMFCNKYCASLAVLQDGEITCEAGIIGIYALCDGVGVKALGKNITLQSGDFYALHAKNSLQLLTNLPCNNSAIIASIKQIKV